MVDSSIPHTVVTVRFPCVDWTRRTPVGTRYGAIQPLSPLYESLPGRYQLYISTESTEESKAGGEGGRSRTLIRDRVRPLVIYEHLT